MKATPELPELESAVERDPLLSISDITNFVRQSKQHVTNSRDND